MKVQTNLYIHSELKEKAKKMGLNISSICEDAIRIKTSSKKSDVPDEVLFMKCQGCGELVEMGYYCQYTKTFYCYDCERAEVAFKHGRTMKYPCSYRKNHEHLRIPGFEGQNNEIVVEVADNGSKEQ